MDIFTGYRVWGWQFFFFHRFWWEICSHLNHFHLVGHALFFSCYFKNFFLDLFSAIWLCVCGTISLSLSCWTQLHKSFTKLGRFSLCCSHCIVSVNVYKFVDSFLCSLRFTVESVSEFLISVFFCSEVSVFLKNIFCFFPDVFYFNFCFKGIQDYLFSIFIMTA